VYKLAMKRGKFRKDWWREREKEAWEKKEGGENCFPQT
jgi:hypothetical protein